MGTILSMFWGEPHNPLGITQNKHLMVEEQLRAYRDSLKQDLKMVEANIQTLNDTLKKSTGSKLEKKAIFAERHAALNQATIISKAVAVVQQQLNTIYQQRLNTQTMQLMRESAVAMLKNTRTAGSTESTLSLIDDMATELEEQNEITASVFASTQIADDSQTSEIDELFEEFLKGENDDNEDEPNPKPEPEVSLPDVPDVDPETPEPVKVVNEQKSFQTPLASIRI